jgi:alkylhydroperoxidase/carboxymuconolactone decarboxylase family protein YurZ
MSDPEMRLIAHHDFLSIADTLCVELDATVRAALPDATEHEIASALMTLSAGMAWTLLRNYADAVAQRSGKAQRNTEESQEGQ